MPIAWCFRECVCCVLQVLCYCVLSALFFRPIIYSLFLSIVDSVWSFGRMCHVSTWCSPLLLNDTWYYFHKNWSPGELSGWEKWYEQEFLLSNLTKKDSAVNIKGVELHVSMSGSYHGCFAVHHRWLCLCGGLGEGFGTSWLLCPKRGASVKAKSPGCAPRRGNNLPVCPRLSSDNYFQAVYSQVGVVCQPFLQEKNSILRTLYPSQVRWPLKLYALLVARTHKNQTLLFFVASGFEETSSLCILPCDPLLLPFSVTRTPSPPQHLWSVSPPNQLFTHPVPTFFSVASSLPVVVEFLCFLSVYTLLSGVFRMIDSYVVVFKGWYEPRVLILSLILAPTFLQVLMFFFFFFCTHCVADTSLLVSGFLTEGTDLPAVL